MPITSLQTQYISGSFQYLTQIDTATGNTYDGLGNLVTNLNAHSASYAGTATNATSASFASSTPTATSASFALTSSYAVSSSFTVSASHSNQATTASALLSVGNAGEILFNLGAGELVDSSPGLVFNYAGNYLSLGGSVVTGSYSFAQGNNSNALKDYSVALNQSTASGSHALSHGLQTTAIGTGSHSEGVVSTAFGNYSHAEGGGTQANGESSHTEGSNTITYGDYSHAEGRGTIARGQSSHAEGQDTVSYGNYSHAEGYGSISSGSYQHVSGQYNTHNNTSSLFIIGNGTNDSSRSDLALFNSESIEFKKPLIVSSSITSIENIIANSFTGSLQGTSSWASYALTASYVANASSFPYTGSAEITGSLTVTGPITTVGGAFMNETTQSVPLTVPTNYNALLIGPIYNSSSIVIPVGSRLVIL